MGTCEVCGNKYDMAFEVVAAGARHAFDSFECGSTRWRRCASTVVAGMIGHGVEAEPRMPRERGARRTSLRLAAGPSHTVSRRPRSTRRA